MCCKTESKGEALAVWTVLIVPGREGAVGAVIVSASGGFAPVENLGLWSGFLALGEVITEAA